MAENDSGTVTLFLSGDVMTGRGVDQILKHPGDPALHEPYIDDARGYVELAERASGPIPRGVAPDYVWGDALAELDELQIEARIVNLETAITTSDRASPDKLVHYRMHPQNARCLEAAHLDACVLANNHALDWRRDGLVETLDTLEELDLSHPGAGRDLDEANAPAVLPLAGGGRVLVFGIGSSDSGIPGAWAATDTRSGVWLLNHLVDGVAEHIARNVRAWRRPGDIVVLSIHWGPNWSFHIPSAHRRLAHAVIERRSADIVHGHSSHHVKGIEVAHGRLILYGCGDLLTDYEGIGGYREYRGELGLLYVPTLDLETGRLVRLQMSPTRVRRMQIRRAAGDDAAWLERALNEQSTDAGLGTRVEPNAAGRLELRWRER